MEAERAQGIVLRTQPVTETSLLVTWYTREWGKLRTLAKGARRPKSPMRGKLDLFYRDELLFLWSKRSELHLLHECFLEEPHAALRESLPKLSAAAYVCELVELASAAEDRNAGVFDLLAETLKALAEGAGPEVVLWFELRLLALGGWAGAWRQPGPLGKLLQSLSALGLNGARRVRLSAGQITATRQCLDPIWTAELGRLPRAHSQLLH